MKTDTVKDALLDAAETAKQTTRAALSEVKSRAGDAAETLRDAAASRAEAARETLADGGARLAETLHDAAGEQATGSAQGRVLEAAAGGVDSIADGLRENNLGSLVSGVQDYARRNPGLFVAGAALAGFAMARFIRSADPLPAPQPARVAKSEPRPKPGKPQVPGAATRKAS